MIPAGYLMVFLIAAVPLAAIAVVWRGGVSARARAWFWSSLSAFAVLLLFPGVYSVAWMLVALGIGYQISTWAMAHPAPWHRAVRRGGVAVALGLAAFNAIVIGRSVWNTRNVLARRPLPPDGAPNILLVIWDTARARNLSLYGYGRPTTPVLDSLASSALVFDYAYSTAPWTLPSHASMLTGQYAGDQSGDWTTPVDRTHRTLPEALYDQGYTTGAFIANLIAARYPSGLHRGFTHYEDSKRTLLETLLSTTLTQARSVQGPYRRIAQQRWLGQAVREALRFDFRPFDILQVHDLKLADAVSDDFLRWQSSARRPFFATLNYMEAHAGYRAPSATKFGQKREDEYDGGIWWLDQELRRVLEELRRRGVLERTIVIVTSDHGELLGEHSLYGHGNSLYAEVLHVPLVILGLNRVPGGVRVRRAVSLRDLARTIQDLSDVGARSPVLPGASLVTLGRDSLAPISPVISQVSKELNRQTRNPAYWGDMVSLIDDTLHVIRDGKGSIEAYAYRTDVAETQNLAQDSTRRALAERLLDDVVKRSLGARR
jgi:arylsulfatase A-like enzyme